MLTLLLVGIMLAEKRLMGNKSKKARKESSPTLVLPSTMELDGFEVVLDSWIDWFNLNKGY